MVQVKLRRNSEVARQSRNRLRSSSYAESRARPLSRFRRLPPRVPLLRQARQLATLLWMARNSRNYPVVLIATLGKNGSYFVPVFRNEARSSSVAALGSLGPERIRNPLSFGMSIAPIVPSFLSNKKVSSSAHPNFSGFSSSLRKNISTTSPCFKLTKEIAGRLGRYL